MPLIPVAPGDKPNRPIRGYTTVRFSNEKDGHRGELDRFCRLERGFYFCAILTMYVKPPPSSTRGSLV